MRTVIPLNQHWLFTPGDVPDSEPDSRFDAVTLPHTNKILPHHNFDIEEYAFISTYRRRFTLPEPLAGRRVIVEFDGAMIASTVRINGHTFPEYKGGYTPFSFDLTDYVTEGENLLAVRLDSSERKDIPPFGFVVDYLTFGGIYRDVRIKLVEPAYITNVFVRPQDVLTTPRLQADVTVRNAGAARNVTVRATLRNLEGEPLAVAESVLSAGAGANSKASVKFAAIPAITLWSQDEPALYYLDVQLVSGDTVLDSQRERFGFREAYFNREDGGFYLNGQRIKLRGLNRHQMFPYIGQAGPARLQRQDADIMRDELGVNIARTSHYPQSPHFLDRCDEIGLLVFEEIPGWQHIGDDAWQAISVRNVQEMIERDRNHPCIMLWGVRINESPDNDGFYEETNTLAHELDPSRQTGGVRNFIESKFLEDVFTYNDFSRSVIDPIHKPHMVTEFNGHMYPTKTWDQEERLIEHALRHANIQDKAHGMDAVAGAIGWCAFDYNTHKEFGSGDRICYHGVMDIFRLPKYAAYFYASQQPPSRNVVLQAATVWSMGDRSEGGNSPLVVFSNCDEIVMYVGGEKLGTFYPDREKYPSLPHAPYTITPPNWFMMWGQTYSDLRLVGFVNGQQVAEQRIASDGLPKALALKADFTQLDADGSDMTRIVFQIVDTYGNRLPYVNQPVTFEVEGPGELIGENPFALIGGQAALYLRATHQAGQVTVRASTPRLPDASVTIQIG